MVGHLFEHWKFEHKYQTNTQKEQGTHQTICKQESNRSDGVQDPNKNKTVQRFEINSLAQQRNRSVDAQNQHRRQMYGFDIR